MAYSIRKHVLQFHHKLCSILVSIEKTQILFSLAGKAQKVHKLKFPETLVKYI